MGEKKYFTAGFKVNWEMLTLIVIVSGIFIRIFHFFINRSLWLDEVYLSSGLLNMNFLELATSPLDYEQQAPIGFLFSVKLFLILLGNTEMTLRLFPLLCGIGSLILFLPVSRYFLNKKGTFISISILAFAPFLIYHSVEIKQYSTAMLACIAALFLYGKYRTASRLSSYIKWGLAGAAIIWFAYSSVFIFAGIAIGVCLYLVYSKNWDVFIKSTATFSLWMVSFLIYYLAFIQEARPEWLINWFKNHNSFMPLPPGIETFKWIAFQFYRILEYPFGLLWNWPDGTFDNFLVRNIMRMPLIPLLFLALGLGTFFKKRKESFMILLFPLFLLLLASGLELYPVYERLTVFIAPIIILLIAKGAEACMNSRGVYRYSYILVVLLLFAPFTNSALQIIAPSEMGGYKNVNYRETLMYVNKNYQAGDVIYGYWNLVPAYRVYKKMGYLSYEAIEGKNVRAISLSNNTYFANLSKDIAYVKGKKRVWLVYDNYLAFHIGDSSDETWYHHGAYGTNPGGRIFDKFKSMGKVLDSYYTRQASVHLFDLSVDKRKQLHSQE